MHKIFSSCVFVNFVAMAALQGENDKLLLAARKVRRATSTEFVISLSSDDFSRASSTYIGKLRHVSFYFLSEF